jgi:glutathione S-transferase
MHNIEIQYFELCPLTRQVRVILDEKKIPYKLLYSPEWKNDFLFEELSYEAQLPQISVSGQKINGWFSILSFLAEQEEIKDLFGKNSKDKNKVNNIISFFNDKFYNEIVSRLLLQKVVSYLCQVDPDSRIIRSTKIRCQQYIKYVEDDLKKFHWLSHNDFSTADLVAASHISILDYMNEIDWNRYKVLKDWYSIIKSRPSMRLVLKDKFSGFEPPKHYMNPDF